MIKITSTSEEKEKREKEREEGIDLIYLWVDGSDSEWIKKKNQFTGTEKLHVEANAKGRFFDNEELKYSLRSVERYIPWLRNIFIITDGQYPRWLNRKHPQIQVVDHKQILPFESLPCFNSNVIECFLYKTPGLAERFLYANDDMFFNRNLLSDFFFDKEDSLPIVRMKKNRFGTSYNKLRTIVGKEPGYYNKIIYRSLSWVEEKFGKRFYGIPHHNVDAYLKSDYQKAVEEVFKKEVAQSAGNHLRAENDVQRFAFDLYALAVGHAHPLYVNKNTSLRNQIYKDDAKERLEKYDPALFCMNDNQKATDEDREKARTFLEAYFPDKSSFEH